MPYDRPARQRRRPEGDESPPATASRPRSAFDEVLRLQTSVGNEAVASLLSGPSRAAVQRVEYNDDATNSLLPADLLMLENSPTFAQVETWINSKQAVDKREILAFWQGDKLTHINYGTAGVAGKEAPQAPLPPGQPPFPSDVRVTHSHPSGSALSFGDVRAAVGRNMAEMRAVGRLGYYSMKPAVPGQWKLTPTTIFAAQADGAKSWKAWCQQNYPTQAGWTPRDSGALLIGATFEEDQFMQKHFTNREWGKIDVLDTSVTDAVAAADRLALYEAGVATGATKRAGYRTGGHQMSSKGGSVEF